MTPLSPHRERPILFSGPMVRAILEGRKTQTRRVVRVRKPTDHLVLAGPYAASLCPYGQPGDRLWVRETWAWPGEEEVLYRASHQHIQDKWRTDPNYPQFVWRPSIFMRRSQSRITLEVTSIRVERLQDISEGDAKAEGVRPSEAPFTYGWENYGDQERRGEQVSYHATARESFESLWDSINGDRANWESNPWVWVVSFSVVSPMSDSAQNHSRSPSEQQERR